MTVRELVNQLRDVDQERVIYIQDIDGTAKPIQRIVDILHGRGDASMSYLVAWPR